MSLFVETLARSHGWSRLYIISPWISEFNEVAGMNFRQLLKRLRDDNATAYVVSRPPLESWHRDAIAALKETGCASIVFVEGLHTKLYCAETKMGSFALLGSANLTQQSLFNREIGVLLRASGAGGSIVRQLRYEAADIYRTTGRRLYCQRTL